MKKPLLLLLVCFFSVFAIAQQPVKLPRELKVSYDKFQDKTEVELELVTTRSPKGSYRGNNYPDLTISYDFEGSSPKAEINKFQFVFDADCETRYCFHDFDDIIFLIDSRRATISEPVFPGAVGSDRIIFELTRSEIETIANAKSVEFQVARIERSINEKAQKLIQILLEYSKRK